MLLLFFLVLLAIAFFSGHWIIGLLIFAVMLGIGTIVG